MGRLAAGIPLSYKGQWSCAEEGNGRNGQVGSTLVEPAWECLRAVQTI